MTEPDDILTAAENHSDEIFALPGVTRWDVGIAEYDGELSTDYAIRIYLDDLSQADGVPGDYDGYPTNVLEGVFVEQADTDRYNPLLAGCNIGTVRDEYRGNATLGPFARHTERGTSCGVTCWHVIAGARGRVGETVYQPGTTSAEKPPPANIIGVVTDKNEDHDCAIIELGDLVPKPEIVELGAIAGARSLPRLIDANQPVPVAKRGYVTGATYGNAIARATVPSVSLNGVRTPPSVTVRLDPAKPNAAPVFSDRGDSGAPVVDDFGQIIGILFGGSKDGMFGIVIPWEDVTAGLPITLIT